MPKPSAKSQENAHKALDGAVIGPTGAPVNMALSKQERAAAHGGAGCQSVQDRNRSM